MGGNSQDHWIEDVDEGAGSVSLPRYHELMWPTLQALKDEGNIVEDSLPDSIFTNPRNDRTRIFLRAVLEH